MVYQGKGIRQKSLVPFCFKNTKEDVIGKKTKMDIFDMRKKREEGVIR